MTIREIIAVAGEEPLFLGAVLVAIPVLTLVVGMSHERGGGGESPWKYMYALLVYAACIPGILAAVLSGYALFFIRANLLDADALIYFLPIVTMVVTLMLIHRRVDFEDVPGFDRLSGLMVLLGIAFVIVLAVEKTRIWLVFGGGFGALIIIAAFAFALLKWGAYALFRRRDDPKIDRPSF